MTAKIIRKAVTVAPKLTSWLLPDARCFLTQYTGKRSEPIEFVVLHASVTPHRTKNEDGEDLARLIATFKSNDDRRSVHFVVARNGTVIQMAPIDRITNHAGVSAYEFGGKKYEGLNAYSIGIELENVGPLTQAGDVFKNCYGGLHTGKVRSYDGQLFEPYTDKQLLALIEIVHVLIDAVPALADPARWLTHGEVSPGRKSDPWKSFPRSYLNRVIEILASKDSAVTATELKSNMNVKLKAMHDLGIEPA